MGCQKIGPHLYRDNSCVKEDNSVTGVPEISIVIPILNEKDSLGELFCRIRTSLEGVSENYEVIFVDDRSIDGTWEALGSINVEDSRFKAVQFSRRFGYQTSIYVGLAQARGELIVTMDSDLQHPPEVIPEMIAKVKEGFDVINMIRSNLDCKSLVARIGSKIFYSLISYLSPTPMTLQAADFRMYTRKVVDSLMEFSERSLFLRGLVGWVGFEQVDMEFAEEQRSYGSSKFNFMGLIHFAVDAIVAFSTSPLYWAIYLGMAIMLFGILSGFYMIVSLVLAESVPVLWFTAISVFLLISGALMVLLGVIGLYVAKMFVEVQARPRYVIDRKIGIA